MHVCVCVFMCTCIQTFQRTITEKVPSVLNVCVCVCMYLLCVHMRVCSQTFQRTITEKVPSGLRQHSVRRQHGGLLRGSLGQHHLRGLETTRQARSDFCNFVIL